MNDRALKSKRRGRFNKASSKKRTRKSSQEDFEKKYRSWAFIQAKVSFWFTLIICSVLVGLELSLIVYAVVMSQTTAEVQGASKLLLSLSLNAAIATLTYKQTKETRQRLGEMYDRAQENSIKGSILKYEKCPVCITNTV